MNMAYGDMSLANVFVKKLLSTGSRRNGRPRGSYSVGGGQVTYSKIMIHGTDLTQEYTGF